CCSACHRGPASFPTRRSSDLVASFLFTYLVAIPIGVYSALKQYSLGDYIFTTIGFLGMATPNFLLAIILMYLSFTWFGDPMLGLDRKSTRLNSSHVSISYAVF